MECPECNIEMTRRKSKFSDSYWWGCPNYPTCKITSSEHPDGTLMSTLANEEIKQLRTQAHKSAEKVFGEWNSPDCKKKEMYDWLKSKTKSGHIGKMDKDELEFIINLLKTNQHLDENTI